MIICNAKIRCINLDNSQDRMSHVLSNFGDVIRIPAINGMQFSDGSFDKHGRPNWSELPSEVSLKYWKMFPTTFGCNLSHIKAWKDLLNSDEEWSIIIEDDTEPVGDLFSIRIPDDCDFYYLIGSDHPGLRLWLFDDGQVRLSRTLAAYLISRQAAILAIQAMDMHYFQADTQVPLRIFDSMRNCRASHPDWEDLPIIKAYGPKDSIIRHSQYAAVSTFTKDGRKPWIPDHLSPQNKTNNGILVSNLS